MSEKKRCFEAEVFFDPAGLEGDIQLSSGEEKTAASLETYPSEKQGDPYFVRIRSALSLDIHWKDPFEVSIKGRGKVGEGRILFPACSSHSARRELLLLLRGGEEDMIRAFAEDGGQSGVAGKTILHFTRVAEEDLLKACQKMEAAGSLIIVSFSPLMLYSKANFDYLCEKMVAFLSRFHKNNPQDVGAPISRLADKFELHSRTLSLALAVLKKRGKIWIREDKIALAEFKDQLSPEEESILESIEEMYIRGKFQSVSVESLRKEFRLPPKQLNRLIDHLVERKRIVQGSEGFILHSDWLDDLVERLKKKDTEELTVSEFKQMTGLSRKFAIPLLELLDQMGITKRLGSVRRIMKR